jgi:ribosomal protein L22
MKENLSVASLKSVKSSPVKVMKVTKNITGLKVSKALIFLDFSIVSVKLCAWKKKQIAKTKAWQRPNKK